VFPVRKPKRFLLAEAPAFLGFPTSSRADPCKPARVSISFSWICFHLVLAQVPLNQSCSRLTLSSAYIASEITCWLPKIAIPSFLFLPAYGFPLIRSIQSPFTASGRLPLLVPRLPFPLSHLEDPSFLFPRNFSRKTFPLGSVALCVVRTFLPGN
jgi:hypothetical protein